MIFPSAIRIDFGFDTIALGLRARSKVEEIIRLSNPFDAFFDPGGNLACKTWKWMVEIIVDLDERERDTGDARPLKSGIASARTRSL